MATEAHTTSTEPEVQIHQAPPPPPPAPVEPASNPNPSPQGEGSDEDSESEANLPAKVREKFDKLKRMEERRQRKLEEERKQAEEQRAAAIAAYPSDDSNQEHAKTENSEARKEVEKTTEEGKGSDAPAHEKKADEAVRIVLPPEEARAPEKPATTTMSAVLREGILGKTINFRTHISISLAPPPDCRVLVRVFAAGINPVDYKLPKVIAGPGVGLDFAGRVVAVRPDTTPFKPGDEVYGFSKGCLADFVTCDAKEICLKPKSLTFAEAAAMPTAYLTAIQGLRKNGFGPGKSILIIGASGGCGLAAVHVARAMGAGEIVGVCSTNNVPLVLQHGADRVIDYTKEKISTAYQKSTSSTAGPTTTETTTVVTTHIESITTTKTIQTVSTAAATSTTSTSAVIQQQNFDLVFDAATGSGGGEDYSTEALKVMKPGGRLVSLNGGVGTWLRKLTKLQKPHQDLVWTEHKHADLAILSDYVEGEGKQQAYRIRPVIGKQLPFTDRNVKLAFDLLRSRRAVGKIVMTMDDVVPGTDSTATNTTTTTAGTSAPVTFHATSSSTSSSAASTATAPTTSSTTAPSEPLPAPTSGSTGSATSSTSAAEPIGPASGGTSSATSFTAAAPVPPPASSATAAFSDSASSSSATADSSSTSAVPVDAAVLSTDPPAAT